MNNIEANLEWDSNFFELSIAELRIDCLNDDVLNNILEGDQKFDLLYIFSKSQNLSKDSQNKFSKTFKHVDTKLIFSTDVVEHVNFDTCGLESYFPEYQIDERVYELAYQSGQYSRFKLDTNFKPSDFKRLYKIWIENSVDRINAKEVIVYKEDKLVQGLITLNIKNKIGQIGLIAVDQSQRNKGIGTKLLNAARNYFFEKGIFKIEVPTQKENASACKFYEKNNFKLIDETIIYHYWK